MDAEPSAAAPPLRVLVIGGGLAGIAAACRLADAGCRVTLLEKRSYLGGRAFSFLDDETDTEVDNGQHLFMRCCRYYIGLLKKLGAYQHTCVQRRMHVPVIGAAGQSALWGAPLPAPLHLLPSLAAYRHLSPADKLRAGPVLLAMLAAGTAGRRDLDEESFYTWLRRHGQSQTAIDRLWNLIGLPTLNGDARQVSAGQALMVFQEGFLADAHAADIGYARVGLSRLLAERAQRYIEARAGEVVRGAGLRALRIEDGRVTGAALSDGVLTADCYVCALPFPSLSAVLPDRLRDDPFFRRASRLKASPIVNLHLWYDRPVTSLTFAAVLDSPVQWLFNRSRMLGLDGEAGQYLLVSLSGADQYIDMKREALRNLFTAELRRLLPAARSAKVRRFLVTRERAATFLPAPGAAALRPSQRTPLPNLFLAGSWTDTGWPDTMESAVRSGVLAANGVLSVSHRLGRSS